MNFNEWRKVVKDSFFTATNIEDGEIKRDPIVKGNKNIITTTYQGTSKEYRLLLKEVSRTDVLTQERCVDHFLEIRGSLHKNSKGENYSKFTFDDLQEEINEVTKNLDLLDKDVKISNLEVGVNVEVPFLASEFITDNIIAFKGRPFNRYDLKNNMVVGVYCPLTQSEIKIYSKGDQYRLDRNLMRFEIKFKKMQSLNKLGIKNLSDLKDTQKVSNLIGLLLKSWDSVILHDNSINFNNPKLNDKQKELLTNGKNPKFWEQLRKKDKKQYSNTRSAYRKLIADYGQKIHGLTRRLIEDEWRSLFVD